MLEKAARWRMEKFYSPSLRQEKQYYIYFPPGYMEPPDHGVRYPVIYLLHGYSKTVESPTIISANDIKSQFPLLYRLLLRKFFKTFFTFQMLDEMIQNHVIPPFLLVQPDGALDKPNIFGTKGLDGSPDMKGCFYLNSASSGRFGDYIFEDLVNHIDQTYRTVPDRAQRGLMGASMGGYGALLGGISHPEQFCAVAALSPAISWFALLDHQMIVPIFQTIFGKKKARELGYQDVQDILDTADMIFAQERPLLPSIERDAGGSIISMDETAKKLWENYDLCRMLDAIPDSFEGVDLLITCERTDEYGFALQIAEFENCLAAKGVSRHIEISDDPFAAKISPHMIGIENNIARALKFCAQHFQ